MIYYLHKDAAECAKMLDDKSLDKQIKAIAQVLCNVHLYDNGDLYNGARENVPLELTTHDNIIQYSEWARTCCANYLMLLEMGLACCEEYKYRFSDDKLLLSMPPKRKVKLHKLQSVIEWARDNVPDLSLHPMVAHDIYASSETTTPFTLAMPKKYIAYKGISKFPGTYTDEVDIIESYRNYYRAKLNKYSNRKKYYENKPVYKILDNPIPNPIIPIWTRREKPDWLSLG